MTKWYSERNNGASHLCRFAVSPLQPEGLSENSRWQASRRPGRPRNDASHPGGVTDPRGSLFLADSTKHRTPKTRDGKVPPLHQKVECPPFAIAHPIKAAGREPSGKSPFLADSTKDRTSKTPDGKVPS